MGSETTRQQISELMDGESDPQRLPALLPQLQRGEGRAAWDLYHQIGDSLRSAQPAPLSEDFGERFAARFATEPLLLPPRRSLMSRIGAWPTALAAVAAAGFGFVVAPAMLSGLATDPAVPAPMAARVSHGSLLAAADDARVPSSTAPTAAGVASASLDYIMMHHRAHASLYGTSPAVQPAGTGERPQH